MNTIPLKYKDSHMKQRTLGHNGPQVSAIGYGAMALSPGVYGNVKDEDSLKTLDYALENGQNFLDTAYFYGYGSGHNEQLLGKAIRNRREKVVLASKGGLGFGANGPEVNGSPANLRLHLETSLQRLGTDYIDVYYLHAPDPKIPVTESIAAMSEFVREGKVRYLGISNFSLEQIQAAQAVHPISASQDQYSLFFRSPEEDGRVKLLQDLGIALVAYSPLGQGILGAAIKPEQGDFRANAARFQGENLEHAQQLGAQFRAIANEAELNPASLALAWLLSKGDQIVPIPGTRSIKNLKSNLAAADLELSTDLLNKLDQTFPASVSMIAAF
jgi:aryl-alcohol dehydrogenase-like predicted oxidoreductase